MCLSQLDVLDRLGWSCSGCLPQLDGRLEHLLHCVRGSPLAQWYYGWWVMAVLDRSIWRPHWTSRFQWRTPHCHNGGPASSLRYCCFQGRHSVMNHVTALQVRIVNTMFNFWCLCWCRVTCTGMTGPEWESLKHLNQAPRTVRW